MTTAEYIYQQLRKAGVTPAGACAVLGNVQAESRFIVNNVEDGRGWSDEAYTAAVDSGSYSRNQFQSDGIGYGVYQITYPTRKAKFYDFAKANNSSIGSLTTQVAFMIKEFKEDFSTCWNLICGSTNLIGCTDKLLEVWENPKFKNYDERRNNASNWYAKVNQLEAASGSIDGSPKESITPSVKKDPVEEVLNLARSEIGYHEKASNAYLDDKTANSGSGNWTKYARDLDRLGNFYNTAKNGYMWCEVFVDWLFVTCFGETTGREMICQPLRSAGAGCSGSADYYKSAGRWHNSPERGDQIFFSYAAGEVSHTGIVESVGNGQVVTIEGNTTDQVGRRSYSLNDGRIYGYGRPRWNLASGGGSQPTPTPVNPTTMLRLGSKGDDVRELQEKLQKLGYDLGRWGADGDYGNDTFQAVRKFQTDNSLEVDGIAGPETLSAVDKAVEALDKKEEPNKEPDTSDDSGPLKFGDVVNFIGKKHYVASDLDIGFSCRPGEAKITGITVDAKHPYHLVRTAGSTSNVYGWVDEADVKKTK